MPSRAFPRLRRRRATRTYYNRHRTARVSATDDVLPWEASTSLRITTVKDITVAAHKIVLAHGHRSQTRLQGPFLRHQLPLQRSTSPPGHRAPPHLRHLPRLRHQPHNPQRRRDGIASFEELPDRRLNLPPKSPKHIRATLARAGLVSRTSPDMVLVRRGEEALSSLTITLGRAQGAGSSTCWVEAIQRTTQSSPHQVCSPTHRHMKT
jgi:hypothetical protein